MSELRAMVQTGTGELSLERFPWPETGEDDGLLRVEACGICGTDVETLGGDFPLALPVIPGHEPVGIVERVGPRAAARWGVEPGDRVAVQSDFGCGRCRGCLNEQTCVVSPGVYGFMSTRTRPGLWGGYAEAMYLAPGSVLHKLTPETPARIAALYNPLGAGFAWAQAATGLAYGDSLAVLGPGQRGLACVIAARACGAGRIFVTGLGSRDAHKLELARELGADVAIDVEREDAVERIRAETGGQGVDAVVDTTPHATRPVVESVQIARPGGTIVLAGIKGLNKVDGFPSDDLAMRYQTVKGVRSVDYHSFRRAVHLIESRAVPVERLHTHEFPLEDALHAVRTLSGETGGDAISITIEPGL